MASNGEYPLSPRTLQLHTDSAIHTTSDANAVGEHQGFTIPQRAISSSSSPGSWVMDPGDGGWHGPRASSPPSFRGHQQQQLAERLQQISPSPSPLNSWAQVPLSPQSSVGVAAAATTAAEYPTMKSPPRSPGGAQNDTVAGEGLVGLAREEISHETSIAGLDPCYIRRSHSDYDVEIYAPSPPPPLTGCPSVSGVETAAQESNCGGAMGEKTTGAMAVGCLEIVKEIGDVDEDGVVGTVDVSAVNVLSAGVDAPALIPPEGFDEPLAEATATVEASHSVGDEPSREQRSHPAPDARAQRGDAETLQFDDARGATVSPSLASGDDKPAAAAAPASVPRNPEVGGAAGVGGRGGNGKQLDRLWKWTGLVTAARMGVIPLIACAAVAALSAQSGEAGQRSDRGNGGGGRAGGGGGSTRGGGGGGGGGCFPSCGERYPYGFAPMPFCAAPCLRVF